MPVAVSYPGVYVQEISSGVHTITGVSTSLTAFVGRTYMGLVNTPVLINGFADFQRFFGGLHFDSPLSYAVRDFFQNGGSQGVVVRLYGAATTPSAGTAALTLGGLALYAASPGDWGNSLAARIDNTGITDEVAKSVGVAKTDLFNLSVTYTPPGGSTASERFTNVSVAQGSGGARLDRVLLNGSDFVRYDYPTATPTSPTVPSPAPGAPTVPPTPSPTSPFTGGAPSLALADSDYLGTTPKTGFNALDNFDLFNLLVMPMDGRLEDSPTVPGNEVFQAAAAYCQKRRAFLLVEPPATWSTRWSTGALGNAAVTDVGTYGPEGRNAAVYFPRIMEQDPLMNGQPALFSASGAIAGIMARTDSARGVWKAPAGVNDGAISGIQGLELKLTDADNGILNPLGINCLRSFPVFGSVVWGARTLKGADQLSDDYKYIPVRRLALYIEESLYRGTQWAVFEPNAEPLWSGLRLAVGSFMNGLFRQGAFAGSSAKDAYFVACDATTTTQADVDAGIVNVTVGFAPLNPAEFVVLSIQQIAGQLAT
jgi:phage tail sheath protein FI